MFLALIVLMPCLVIYPKNKGYVCGVLLHVRSFICPTQTPVYMGFVVLNHETYPRRHADHGAGCGVTR